VLVCINHFVMIMAIDLISKLVYDHKTAPRDR
jgi:hypothetical protein